MRILKQVLELVVFVIIIAALTGITGAVVYGTATLFGSTPADSVVHGIGYTVLFLFGYSIATDLIK